MAIRTRKLGIADTETWHPKPDTSVPEKGIFHANPRRAQKTRWGTNCSFQVTWKAGNMVSETVGKIEELLSEAVALQKEYVGRICVKCQDPCCSRVHYLYNLKSAISTQPLAISSII